MPVESVTFTYNGTTTAVATVHNSQLGVSYQFRCGDPGSSPVSDVGTGADLVLTVSDIVVSLPGNTFSGFVRIVAGAKVGASVFQDGATGEYTFDRTWTFDGDKTVTVTFPSDFGEDYQLTVIDSAGSGASPDTNGTGSLMQLEAEASATCVDDYFWAYLERSGLMVANRLFTAGLAGAGFPGNPGSPIVPAPDPGGGIFIAFSDSSLEADPTWIRLDDPNGYDLAQKWSIDRGRSSELDKTKTGEATIEFVDPDGVLDPTNLSGPFYGLLDPMKQVKIDLHDPIADTDTTIFRGFVSEWLYDMDISETVAHVTLECADAFDLLSALELTPSHHGATTGLSDFADVWFEGTPSNVPGVADVAKHVDTRIDDVLDDAGWPAGLRDIFSGNVEVQGVVYARRDQALQALQDAADAEFPGVANVYVAKDGTIRFRGRFARFFPNRVGYGIGSWKAGDMAAVLADADTAPISGLSFRRSKLDLINAALALPQNVDETDVPGALVKDDTSIAAYGWRAVSFNDLLVTAGHDDDDDPTTALEECDKYANYYVGNYKDPKTRVQTLRFLLRTTGPNAAKLCLLMCGVEIGDQLALVTSHPGGGGFDESFFVEGVRYQAEPRGSEAHQVTLELDLSPQGFYSSNPFGEWDDS